MTFIKSNKNKSIKKRVIGIFILITAIMILAFFISMSLKNKVLKEYNELMDINIQLNKLSVELNINSDSFNKYIVDKEEIYYFDYIKSKNEIKKILNIINYNVKLDKESSIFFRTTQNMFEYYEKNANMLSLNKELDIEGYNKWQELKSMSKYLNINSQLLSKSYLEYSNKLYSDMLNKSNDVERKTYGIILFFGIISLFFAIFLSNEILGTITILSNQAQLLSRGSWDVPDIEKNEYIELNTVGTAFNNMKASIKDFIEEMKQKSELELSLNNQRLKMIEKDKLLRESELMALQMQMDPHFLFNTLNTIARISMFEGGNDTVRLIESMSRILRYNLLHHGELVPLKEEVLALKSYIIIQETRFQEQMKFVLNVDSNEVDVLIPPMIIQPIVENAIIHGLRNVENGGIVRVDIKSNNEFIEILVEDNGVGISKDKIQEILIGEIVKNEKSNKASLGLSNVKKRLELYYNMNNLFSLDSEIDKGTKVKIMIPKEEYDKNA